MARFRSIAERLVGVTRRRLGFSPNTLLKKNDRHQRAHSLFSPKRLPRKSKLSPKQIPDPRFEARLTCRARTPLAITVMYPRRDV